MTLRRPRNALEARNPTLAKTNLLDCTHLPLIPSAFPLSTHSSGRMQAYSEVVKRHPEAWKTALPSLIPFSRRRSQAIYSTPRSRRHPKSCPRYVRDILDNMGILCWPERASAAMRRACSQARSLYGRQSLPKREGLLSARTLASNVGSAGLRPLRPHRDSANFRTFCHRRPPAVVETPCTIQAIQKTLTRRGHPRTDRHADHFRRSATGVQRLPDASLLKPTH